MQVDEIMTTDLATVTPETSLYDAADLMLRRGVGSALVVDAGLIGILTRSDILHSIVASANLRNTPVRDAMSDGVVTVERGATITMALRTMIEHEIRKLPIMEGIDVVGILTLTDIALHQPARVEEVRRQLEQQTEWT